MPTKTIGLLLSLAVVWTILAACGAEGPEFKRLHCSLQSTRAAASSDSSSEADLSEASVAAEDSYSYDDSMADVEDSTAEAPAVEYS